MTKQLHGGPPLSASALERPSESAERQRCGQEDGKSCHVFVSMMCSFLWAHEDDYENGVKISSFGIKINRNQYITEVLKSLCFEFSHLYYLLYYSSENECSLCHFWYCLWKSQSWKYSSFWSYAPVSETHWCTLLVFVCLFVGIMLSAAFTVRSYINLVMASRPLYSWIAPNFQSWLWQELHFWHSLTHSGKDDPGDRKHDLLVLNKTTRSSKNMHTLLSWDHKTKIFSSILFMSLVVDIRSIFFHDMIWWR